ncbi:helix-turn-helix domain-containing protein, partial [bacterium]
LNLAVPETVAVVGVDNAPTFCELCSPPLSSVRPDAERIGFEAAALLDKMMEGETQNHLDCQLPPLEVVTRQSSDTLAIENPLVVEALRFIREHACEGISVDDILSHLPISRSSLERAFRHHVGRSPQEEIRHVRVKRIKQLLVETDYTLGHIAKLTGFEHPEYMMVQFKRLTGQTPSQWRQNGAP